MGLVFFVWLRGEILRSVAIWLFETFRILETVGLFWDQSVNLPPSE